MRRISSYLAVCAFIVALCGQSGETAKLDTKAVEALRASLDFLGKARTYSTTLTHKMTLDGGPNKKKETTAKYEIAVERPNKLALVIKDGKLRCAVISDGRTLCTYSPELKKYANLEAPKSISELFEIPEMELVLEDLDNLLFLDQLNMNDAIEVIMKGAQTLTMSGPEAFGDFKAYRLHFSLEKIDWDLWIQDGPQPLVRKVSMEGEKMMKDATGQVKVKVTIETKFDDWKINQPIPQERFTFTPPPDATKVAAIVKRQPNPQELVGRPAPSVKLQLMDGQIVDIASFTGKNVVVLDFWATWCGPCRMAMPVISEVTASYKEKGLLAFAVNLGEEQDKVEAFKKATPALTMPILMDKDTRTAEAYKILTIPMTVIIGKDGIVQRVHQDVPKDMEVLRKILKQEFDTVIGGGSLLKPAEKKEGNGVEPEAK